MVVLLWIGNDHSVSQIDVPYQIPVIEISFPGYCLLWAFRPLLFYLLFKKTF